MSPSDLVKTLISRVGLADVGDAAQDVECNTILEGGFHSAINQLPPIRHAVARKVGIGDFRVKQIFRIFWIQDTPGALQAMRPRCGGG